LSSLQKCSMRQMQSITPIDYSDIHRLSLRLAQHEMDAFVNLTVDGNSTINDSYSHSRSPSPKSVVDDVEVAQKIAKGIHQRIPSSNHVLVADLRRRHSHFHESSNPFMKVDDDNHNRNKSGSALSVGALFNATNATNLSDEEDIDEFTKTFDDKLQKENKRVSVVIDLQPIAQKTKNKIYQRSSDTYSTKCINEQEDIEIDDTWDSNLNNLNQIELFTPQGIDDEAQDPLFADPFSPVSIDSKQRQVSLPSVSGYWDEEKTDFYELKNEGIYV